MPSYYCTCHRSAILENILWTLCQPHHTDMFSMFVNALIWTKKSISGWCGWHRSAYTVCVQRMLSKMSLRWCGGDELLNKVYFLLSLRTKKYYQRFFNYGWTTDGRWTIPTMLFILFWALKVLIVWQSMGPSQTSRFHPKYLKLCSEDEQSFYGFGLTCG